LADRAFFFCVSKFAEYAVSAASPNFLMNILLCSGDCAVRYWKARRPDSSGSEPHYDGFSQPASVVAGGAKNLAGLPALVPAQVSGPGKTQEKRK
jgi:hypothetical protein